ncbi:trichohyalin-like [Macrobrachium rosenbergii]|uniref:trichohyalin-like n=1 Tax=Macrobrachium rosenbergii TaxID=79674 RepID=UPI0034D696F3
METRPNSGGIETSAFAGAVPWMALMAGALALPLAVYWKLKLIVCDDLDREEDDLEVPALDVILETEDLESSDEEEDEDEDEDEEESFGTEELYTSEEEEEEEDKEEEIFGTEELYSIEEERKLQSVFQQTMDEKDRELESAFEKANELSLRLKEVEANNQVLASERDCFKRANEEKEREVNHQQELLVLRAIKAEKDQLQLGVLENQILNMKEDHMALQRQLDLTEGENSRLRELATFYEAQLEASHTNIANLEDRNCEHQKNLANETQRNISLQNEVLMLKDQVQSQQSALRHKESQLVSETEALNTERAKNEITGAELEVMRNWVTELGGENILIKEDLRDRCLDITLLRKKLGNEQEKTQILKEEVQMLREREEQLRDNLESAMHQQQSLELSLKHAEGEICSLKKAESINLCELEQLRKECERLREKCRIQEDNTIKERKCFREHLRTQEEELRNQDKYMLMTLLHGTAQRNFHLEHIALDCRNKSLDNNSEQEDPDKRSQEKDLLDQVQKLEEEQFRMYCNAQQEKDDYGKPWAVLTQMLEDLIQGDERKNC